MDFFDLRLVVEWKDGRERVLTIEAYCQLPHHIVAETSIRFTTRRALVEAAARRRRQ